MNIMFKKKQTKQQDNRKEIIEMSDQLKTVSTILKDIYKLIDHSVKVKDLSEKLRYVRPSTDDMTLKKDLAIKKDIDELKLLINKTKHDVNIKDLEFILKNIEVGIIERNK